MVFGIVGCSMPQEEKENIAIVSCNIMSESVTFGGKWIAEINSARNEIGESPFLGKSQEIFESMEYGLCKELVLNDVLYSEKLAAAKAIEELERIEAERIEAKRIAEEERIAEEKRIEAERIAEERRIQLKIDAAMPLANVLAIYPERALRREIKGYVDIVFTISETGNVEDIKLLNGYCRSDGVSRECSIFNDAAMQAARLLKFSPIIDNGVAIRATNKKWTFSFNNLNK